MIEIENINDVHELLAEARKTKKFPVIDVEQLLKKFDETEVRELITDTLKQNNVKVRFQKANKQKRTLNGTLNLGSIPKAKHPKGGKPENPEVRTVFDIDKDEWRSFRIDSLISVQVIEPLT